MAATGLIRAADADNFGVVRVVGMDERPVLVVNEGELAGQRWTLNDSELIIGRGNDSDVVLPERQVSRHHLKVLYRDGRYLLEDLDSKNGTFLNGQQIQDVYKRQMLKRRRSLSSRRRSIRPSSSRLRMRALTVLRPVPCCALIADGFMPSLLPSHSSNSRLISTRYWA